MDQYGVGLLIEIGFYEEKKKGTLEWSKLKKNLKLEVSRPLLFGCSSSSSPQQCLY